MRTGRLGEPGVLLLRECIVILWGWPSRPHWLPTTLTISRVAPSWSNATAQPPLKAVGCGEWLGHFSSECIHNSSPLLPPVKMHFPLCMKIPGGNSIVVGSDNCAHSFGFCFEVPMAEQAASKNRSLVLPDVQVSQTIACMTQIAPVKTQIQCEERWTIECVQERNNLRIFHPLPSYLIANLSNRNAPTPQKLALTFRKIFI